MFNWKFKKFKNSNDIFVFKKKHLKKQASLIFKQDVLHIIFVWEKSKTKWKQKKKIKLQVIGDADYNDFNFFFIFEFLTCSIENSRNLKIQMIYLCLKTKHLKKQASLIFKQDVLHIIFVWEKSKTKWKQNEKNIEQVIGDADYNNLRRLWCILIFFFCFSISNMFHWKFKEFKN